MKNSYVLLLSFFLIVSCKTSGDLRAEKMNQDPAEIKTISTPLQQQQTHPVAKSGVPSSAVSVSHAPLNEDLAREVEILRGQIQEQNYAHNQEKIQYEARIATLEKEKTMILEEVQALKGAAPTVQSKKGGDLLWETALKDLRERNYSEAAITYKEFLENYPKDERAEEALIRKAQAEYASDQFKASLVDFSSYLDKYPKGHSKAMAWLGQGTALIRMKQKKDAKLFLEQCVTLFPKSKEAKLARKLLKTPNLVPPTIFAYDSRG